MSDKELDDLFKEASGKMDMPFEASDWQKMETLLDDKGGIRSAFWNWKTYTLATLLLLFGTTTTIILLNTKEEESLSPQEEQIMSPDKSLAAESGTENKVEAITPLRTKEALDRQEKEMNKPVVIRKAIGLKLKEQRPAHDRVGSLKIDDSTKIHEEITSFNDDAKTPVIENGSGSASHSNVESESSSTDSTVAVKPDEELKAKDSTEEKSSDKNAVNNHSFSVKAVLSPDFSSVGYFTPGETGFNYGLLAEYGLGKHFSVSAGAIWSKKLYSSESEESSGYGQVLSSKTITGDCRILDIPILINYYFNPGHRFTVYGSMGLSSYIMFKEVYNYEVVKGGKSYDYTTSVERKNNEWLKMANISIGLQYRLANQWSLQAEPFVKAPLAGIGEGGIKLVSSGIFINIKYTFK